MFAWRAAIVKWRTAAAGTRTAAGPRIRDSMQYPHSFGCIVVGGGHAGTEAALAAARQGVRTLLLTQSLETLGQMSCNPAIGGIGKGHLTKEIDALGGAMATAIDRAGIHFRILNASKGPAVRATRAQADRLLYKRAIREILDAEPNLTLLQQTVDGLLLEGARVRGVVTQAGMRIEAATVVLTVGTFLDGKIHVGQMNYSGGRAGDPASLGLARTLRELGLNVGRLKTGTPPRIDGRTVDYAGLETQPGDEPVPVFSFLGRRAEHPRQVPCHITHTTEATHAIIRAGLDRSPLYTGAIEGIGPRYCPSIEDKVVRFADRTRHQIFIEPEGLTTHEIYPNGISTSLPFDVQLELVHSIPGFERAHVTRPGYAIEYDFFDPRDLSATLETKAIERLFFAGQINGTTGYEEAAAQGIVAGINAGRVRAGSSAVVAEPLGCLHRRVDRRPHHARHDGAVPHVHEPRRVSVDLARGQRRFAPNTGRPRARRRRRRALASVRDSSRAPRARDAAPARHRRAARRRARLSSARTARRATPRPTAC